ncbi:MAG: DUF92 domain-containing protein [Acidobacteriota bacterium]
MARTDLRFIALFGSATSLAFTVLLTDHRTSALATLSNLPFAVLVSLPIAVAAAALRLVSRSGAAAGVVVASTLLAGAGWPAWSQLAVAFAFTALATRAGRRRNTLKGLIEDRDGRGWRSVTANTGLAALAAFYAHDAAVHDLAAVVIASVLVAGSSDTVASEIGQAFGGRSAVGLFPLRRVPPGTPGAISLVGTLAGAVSASLMAMFGGVSGLVSTSDVAAVAVAGTAAVLLDSVISRQLEIRGWLDNDGVNLLATAAAGLLGVGLHRFWT